MPSAPDVTLEPMTVGFAPDAADDLRERLRRTRPPAPPDDDWSRGVAQSWLAGVLADWEKFDIAGLEQRFAELTHLRAEIGDQRVHVLIAEGRAAAGGAPPVPLLLANGWPSSFCEYLDVLPPLTDPGAHGGDPADAFTVVAPALPGFGFSGPTPAGGYSAAEVGQMWHQLMRALGHSRYAAHGSDLGAGVVAQMARAQPDSVAGIHLATPGFPLPPQPWNALEQAYAGEVEAWSAEEGAYAHQHATKPNTLGAALNDSPAGLAAWIGEKAVAWSSRTADGQPAFPRDLLLATLTVYWATGTIASSMLPYWRYRHDPTASLPADDPSPVPAVVSVFGGEIVPFPKPPRDVAERFLTVAGWEEYDRGGHFPAAAEPDLFVRALRDAFRPLRGNAL
ncbi:MAG TPA: alpha/beta fold hydrolase [Actinocrinis sp.]|jgi:pimeloyl-ACP methyl ester carboxylesterase